MTEMEHDRLTRVEDRSKSNTHRIESLEKRQDDTEKLVTSVAIIAEKQKDMEGDVKEMKGDVKKLIEKPAKRWEGVVEKVLYTIVGAVVAYLLAKGGF
ncbi:MAG: hypothetical protein J6K12_05275 [Clostridia bacterium]|nr:hypothetical protein [Clostridia bacterium]